MLQRIQDEGDEHSRHLATEVLGDVRTIKIKKHLLPKISRELRRTVQARGTAQIAEQMLRDTWDRMNPTMFNEKSETRIKAEKIRALAGKLRKEARRLIDMCEGMYEEV